MTLVEGPACLRRLQRAQLQPWLPHLRAWLLPGAPYAVEHTWPQLYRSDGRGDFLGLFVDDALVSHLAWRRVRLRGARTALHAALLGSVATAPAQRGRGHASRLLAQAVADCRAQGVDGILLWAEQPELYARVGFAAGEVEPCLLLARRPHAGVDGIRLATVADHAELHALHRHKPLGVERSAGEMSGLLTTPGLTTTVLADGQRILAYACCGKGADLQGWWHECGGSDADVARLLLGSMQLLGQTRAPVIVPPYRPALAALLGPAVLQQFTVAGPMRLWCEPTAAQALFVDGLDSV